MHSERRLAASANIRTVAANHTNLEASTHVKLDTRRFAAIFPPEVPEVTSTDCGDTSHEEQNDSDDFSRFEFVPAVDENSQPAPVTNSDQSSTLSAAQQIIACYRAVHGSDLVRECAAMKTGDKGHSQVHDDQHSMYTLAAPSDAQSTMDMMWRPKPKVHMRRTDQRALMQAQSQAIAMMNDAGLKPTNEIQCRRRGCANILPDVEALKYHLHIHNIAELASRREEPSSSAARKPSSLVQYSATNSKLPKRNHSRSKSFLGQDKHSTSPLPRKLSAGSLLPSLFSSHQSTPEVPEVLSLTTVAKTLTADSSTNQPARFLPVCNAKTPSHGRRQKKESTTVCTGDECGPSLAMLLSPPSSLMPRDRFMLSPDANFPMPVTLSPVKDGKSEIRVSIRKKGAIPLPEQLMGSRSPVRALSPTRAMSPIRDGIKRILSIGAADNISDK